MRRPVLAGITLAALVAAGCGTATTPEPAPTTGPTATAAATSGATDAPAAACAVADAGATPDVTVEIRDFAYDPEPVQAAVGDVIGWTNADGAPHSATLDEGDCSTGSLSSGSSGALTFSQPGTYTYHCLVHPGQMADYTIEVAG
jgi:plastocyanin